MSGFDLLSLLLFSSKVRDRVIALTWDYQEFWFVEEMKMVYQSTVEMRTQSLYATFSQQLQQSPQIKPNPPQFLLNPSQSIPSLLFPPLIPPLSFQKYYLKLDRKSIQSMASRFHNDQTSIHIEYCRSCETHSWCTHHDESKYHDTFLKFSEMMGKRLPQLQVVGNMVPQNLIPFKIAENKYIDANTNKYVVFPHIGSFEVTFQGKLIFSKKETHTWPNIPSIISKIATIIDPQYHSPAKPEENHEEDRETSKVSNNNSFLDSEEDKKTKYKVQQKGFTLTDHFKLYRPKNTFEDKEWMTQKHESEASLKQFSEMGRLESREKSNKSLQSKKSSDLVGESKLKEMLKQKGAASKEQGKKEMIIRLDSIQEENAYEEAAMATQRTQEKNIKKNRMKEIDEQINSLQDKFKRFQNRVHDIQARNKDFERVEGSADEKSRFKQIMENRQEVPRNLSTKKEAEKEKGLLADKTNKLEQYLTYSQQEKNDKLHRIYGEWKLIKQFSTKNKKLLKGKQQVSQQQEVDDSVSDSTSKADSHSQSPSSFANIITFKQKNEKSMDRRLKNIKNQKQHKYSSMERYNKGSSQLMKDITTHTDDNFYKNHKFLRPKAEIQSQADIHAPHPVSKLIKKSVNTLSMNALKSLNNATLPKIENDSVTIDHFSNTAKANIGKINNRISNIQQKLKHHNANIQPIVESPNRERNASKKSRSNSNSSQHVSLKKVAKPNKPNQRNSNASSNAIKKNFSQDKIKNSNFSQLSRPQTKKINEKSDALAEESEFKPHQSKRKEARYAEGPVVRESPNKKLSQPTSNRLSSFEENGVKASRSKDGNKVIKEKPEKKQDKKVLQRGSVQNKPVEPQSQSQSSQEEGEKFQPHPHEARQAKPLARKFKDWRESSPTHNVLKSKELQRKFSKQGLNEKIRESDSKQTVIRNKKYKVANKVQQAKPNNNNEKLEEKSKKNEEEVHYPLTQEKKSRSGQIKKNRIVAKKSSHREAKPRGKLFDYNINGSRDQSLHNEQHSQQAQSQENNEQGIRNSNQSYENPSRNIETPSSNGISESKMRKTLGYFKVSQLCYRGARTSERDRASGKLKENQASFYEVTHQEKDYVRQQENEVNRQGQGQRQEENDSQRSSESQFVPKCTKRQEQQEAAEKAESQGWRNKSQEENEMLPQEIANEEEKVRKNSIEQKLEEKEEEDPADPVHEVKTTNVMNNNDEPEVVEQRAQTAKDVCVFEPQQSAHLENHSQPINQKVETTDSHAPTKKESKKKAKKQKKQKKKQAQVKPAVIQPQIDLQQQTCREYSEFLEYKISNDLCKAVQLQKTEIQYNDSEYKVNVFNCQSQVSIEEGQQQAEMQFNNFQPSKPVNLEQPQQEVQQDGENEEQEEEQEQEQDSVDEEQQVQDVVEVQRSELETIKSKTISGKQECYAEQEKQATSINNTPETPIILAQEQPSLVKESAQPQNITRTPIVSAQVNNSSVNNPSPSPKNSSFVSQPAPTPMESTPKQPQYDNVYSQSKKPSPKFAEIGVQKQMTNQVSIQTDTHHRDDTLFLGRKSTLFNINQEPIIQSTTPDSKEPAEPIDPLQNEFQATVRNNYLSQRKNLTFSQEKSRRQIIRAKITNQILSQTRNQQMQKYHNVMIDKADAEILKEEGAVASLSTVYNQGLFISERDLQVDLIKTKFNKYLKVLEILAERGSWIVTRLFEDLKGVMQEKAFGVWLCKDFQWECFVVDDNIQVDQGNLPLYTLHTGNQKWANVLEKAIAKAIGGYEQLLKAETGDLFMLLTGCNSISVKVKEDPSKNGKLLQLIGDCQRKNYIVHAQKNIDRMKQDRDRESVYYVLAVKKLSSDEEPILEISQDGRESFWMRLSKFTQEFSKVEILQLRVNHLFTHIDIGVGKESQLTVIELAFAESGQGCVTLTYIDHIAPLTAYLYREEKSRVLKLVGQAREKQKSHLFFQCNFNEGKYYVFAQTKERSARLCYYGENSPTLRITEEIHNDGLKNEVAQYLPIKQSKQPRKRELEETWNDWKGKAPRFKDNFMQSRLRENFVEYIMGQTKRKEAQF